MTDSQIEQLVLLRSLEPHRHTEATRERLVELERVYASVTGGNSPSWKPFFVGIGLVIAICLANLGLS